MSRARSTVRAAAGWRPSRRAVLWTLAATVGLVLLAHPVAGADSDVFSNIGPASQVPRGALMDAYPLGHYQLDHHFSAVKAGVFKGVDVSGIPPTIAVFLANIVWQITAFLAQVAIVVFTFAFSLDLLSGSPQTGGTGALEPVSRAVRSIYETTFGAPWLIVAILLTGLWAIWQALVRRRYVETAGSLALSVVLVVIALAFVAQPERTIGSASRLTNQMSGAFLSLTSRGALGDQARAKRDASDQLFSLLVYEPWTVLQFGGREHCVKAPVDQDDPVSVGVRPLSTDGARDARLSEQLRRTGQVDADGKTCIDNERRYAAHFLPFGSDSDQRKAEYEAIKDADAGKLPDEDPTKSKGAYKLTAADKPAVDAMGKGGQYQRLLLSIVIFAGELGAVLLLGALAFGVVLAQVLVLLLLAFAPVVLVIAVFPGRGHELFLTWLARMAGLLLRKALYSLILAVLLTVAAAMQSATTGLGWLMAWGLQAAFFWTVLLGRRQLVDRLTVATVGRGGGDDGALRLAALYGATRATRRLLPGTTPEHQPTAPPPARTPRIDREEAHAAPPAPPAPQAEDPAPAEDAERPRDPDDPRPSAAPGTRDQGADDASDPDRSPAPATPAGVEDANRSGTPEMPTTVPARPASGAHRSTDQAPPGPSAAPAAPAPGRAPRSSVPDDPPPSSPDADRPVRPAAGPDHATSDASTGRSSDDRVDTGARSARPSGSPLVRELDRDATRRPAHATPADVEAPTSAPLAAVGAEAPARPATPVRRRDDEHLDPGTGDGPSAPPEVAS